MDFICEGIKLLFSERYWNVASVVGVLWLSWLSLKLVKAIAGNFCAFFLAPWGISRLNLKKYGEWAVVTGASEGIGRGYALELARRGLNVVLISRSKEKLQKVADEIKQQYSREVRIMSADFSAGMSLYPKLAEDLKDLDIGVLVNNVGLGQDYPEMVDKYPAEKYYKMIEINCQSMVQMVKVVLPKMLDKKKGVIVNLSSSAGSLMLPMMTVYASTKGFVDSFSLGLRKEYASRGIVVQCVAPYTVATAMSGFRHTNIFIPDGETFARAAVATIGIKKYTHGCLSHAIQGYILPLVPDRIFWSYVKDIKARYLEQKAKESKAN